ncbi:MAG: restriction endonuclease subunit S [Methylococcaceae bacterium]
MNWDLKSLDEIGFIGRGKSRHRPRNAEHLYGGEYPFVQTGDIKAAGFRINTYTQTYNETGLAQSKLWKEGTLCITIAANIADTAILGIDACFPDSIIGFVADENKCDVRFVKYFFDIFQARMKSISTGAAQDNLSLEKLLTFKIPIPQLSIQRKIASILSAYDDLIENNLKLIKLLEEQAQLHYKELVQNSATWNKVKLEKFVSVVKGRKPINVLNHPEEDSQLYLLLDTIEKGKTLYTTDLSLPQSKITDVLMCMDGARSGLSFRGMVGAIGSTMAIWRSNSERVSGEYLFQFMKQNESAITQGNTGAAIPHANRKFILDMEIGMPSKKEADYFDKLTMPMIKLMNTLHNQNTKLREARDILLPKLMNGQIGV